MSGRAAEIRDGGEEKEKMMEIKKSLRKDDKDQQWQAESL